MLFASGEPSSVLVYWMLGVGCFPFLPVAALLTPELLRRLEQFQLLAARRAKSSARGERRSRARGQSVEFADYRTYVPGDDFRYLDWNLYGRLERLFLKLYEEERELPVRIFLDASESMTFGEPRKFDFARQVAAAVVTSRYAGLIVSVSSRSRH